MIFLAHRGLWTEPQQRNTRTALASAFSLGFGVETDIRDHNGRLVISHDMPTEQPLLFSDVLVDYDAAGRPGHLALNIKADGLTGALMAELDAFPNMRSSVFVFDMSIPDTLNYLNHSKLRVFTRHSEYEPQPPLAEATDGVWMDCFVNQWVEPVDASRFLKMGKQVAIVSPELHKRDVYRTSWQLIKTAMSQDPSLLEMSMASLMLCTDFPREAAAFFKA